MTKDEAFERFIKELDFQDIAHDTESIKQLYFRAWQAAKRQSDGEIAELELNYNRLMGDFLELQAIQALKEKNT